MSTTAEAVAVATEAAPPATADQAEALVRELDAARAEVAQRYQAHNRYQPRGADPEWTRTMREISAEGLALDRQRSEAKRLVRQLREREASGRQWEAWFQVRPEHAELCPRIAECLDQLVPMLEGEREMHRQLKEAVGESRLHVLHCDVEGIRRLHFSADLVGRPKTEAPEMEAANDPGDRRRWTVLQRVRLRGYQRRLDYEIQVLRDAVLRAGRSPHAADLRRRLNSTAREFHTISAQVAACDRELDR